MLSPNSQLWQGQFYPGLHVKKISNPKAIISFIFVFFEASWVHLEIVTNLCFLDYFLTCAEASAYHVEVPTADPTMIGVVVGLALMSVTLCIVLRLFAK